MDELSGTGCQTYSNKDNWRRKKAILVFESGAFGMIAVIRSLGRAGYDVHACASDCTALGLKSRFASHSIVHVPYRDANFLTWLLVYLEDHSIDAIVPSEAFLIAVLPIFGRLSHLLPCGPNRDKVYRCLSKYEVTRDFLDSPSTKGLWNHLPGSVVWSRGEPIPGISELLHLTLPLFIKVDDICSEERHGSRVLRVSSHQEGVEAIRQLVVQYASILVQGFVPGSRVVADFCIWQGKVRSRSMMLAKHESPHYGGISTLRSIWWDQEICDDAEKRLSHLGVEGVAMMEYRRDPRTGRYYFIEINSRYWTGLHVELSSGYDIPRLHLDAFFGVSVPAPSLPREKVMYRFTVPGEVSFVISLLKDPYVSLRKKIWAILEFFLLGLNPRVKSDLNFPGDRMLYLLAWKNFLVSEFDFTIKCKRVRNWYRAKFKPGLNALG